MIRACIVSEVRLYREGLAEILARHPGIDVVGSLEACDGTPEEVRELDPDVVLLDVAGWDGEGRLSRYVDALPETRVVALAVSESEAEILGWAEAGVAGFVTRDSSLEELVAALESVARGEVLCSPRVSAALLRRVRSLARGRGPAVAATRLTARELEVLELVGDGCSNKEIARRLSIELSTVKNHVHNILEKLGVHRRSEAAAALGPRATV